MAKTFDTIELLRDNTSLMRTEDEPSFDDNIETIDLLDIDQSMFDIFDKQINTHVQQDNISIKVPVIYASGERWALVRQRKALRDENGTIILPVIAMRRTAVNRSHENSLPASGPALDRVVYKIKRSDKNANYQNVRNSTGLRHQDNAFISYGLSKESGTGKTSRRRNARAFSGTVFRGKELDYNYKPEIVDIYTIPYPDFFVLDYEISIWAQYQQQMNTMLQTIFNAFESFSIDTIVLRTKKGYYFVGYLDEAIDDESNFDEFTDTERIIRQTLKISVAMYTIQTQLGDNHLVRKYTSAPEISFSVIAIDEVTDITDLRKKNPLLSRENNEIEDLSKVEQARPRKQRQTNRSSTRKLHRRRIGETAGFFPNIEELERFFK